MKTTLTTVFALLLLSALTFGQSNDKTISDIDNIKTEIKSNLTLFKKTNETGEDGYRNIYKDYKSLTFIELNIIDKSTQADTPIEKHVEWYFSKGHLIYSEQTWTNTKTKQVIDNQKMYLDQSNLIKWVKFDQVISQVENQEYADLGKQLYDYGEKLYSKVD